MDFDDDDLIRQAEEDASHSFVEQSIEDQFIEMDIGEPPARPSPKKKTASPVKSSKPKPVEQTPESIADKRRHEEILDIVDGPITPAAPIPEDENGAGPSSLRKPVNEHTSPVRQKKKHKKATNEVTNEVSVQGKIREMAAYKQRRCRMQESDLILSNIESSEPLSKSFHRFEAILSTNNRPFSPTEMHGMIFTHPNLLLCYYLTAIFYLELSILGYETVVEYCIKVIQNARENLDKRVKFQQTVLDDETVTRVSKMEDLSIVSLSFHSSPVLYIVTDTYL